MTPKQLYDKYAHESYQNSYDHGFWENKDQRNKDEMIMLMVNELSECQEAYRSSKHTTTILSFESMIDYPLFKEEDKYAEWYKKCVYPLFKEEDKYAEWYKKCVKGCTGEELADVVIRIFDYVVGWNLPYIDIEDNFNTTTLVRDENTNFSEDLLGFVEALVEAQYDDAYWTAIIAALILFANDWNIDLDWHIAHKQRYNRTRPYKHGKLF